MPRDNDEALLAEFVAAFAVLGDLTIWTGEAIPAELVAQPESGRGSFPKWKPVMAQTSRAELDPLLSTYGIRFPELYEKLILSYRWRAVDLSGLLRLFANPPGPLAQGLFAEIAAEPLHVAALLPSGLVPFARAPDDFDPVCFDISKRSAKRDYPLVQIDHEELLCRERIVRRRQLWPTFRSFATTVVATARM
jgi:hypothetical protein